MVTISSDISKISSSKDVLTFDRMPVDGSTHGEIHPFHDQLRTAATSLIAVSPNLS